MFKLVDSVLFRQKIISNDLELVVPDSLKEQALFLHHYISSAAHQGIARTKAKLKEKFFLGAIVKGCGNVCVILFRMQQK